MVRNQADPGAHGRGIIVDDALLHNMSRPRERFLLWDFDGTLGYRDGAWSGAVLEAFAQVIPNHSVTIADIRPHLSTGFPWHASDIAHTHLESPDEWWQALSPVFMRAFHALDVDAIHVPRLLSSIRACYCNPLRWRLFDDTLLALQLLADKGWKHIIVSNHVPELAVILTHLQLTPHIQATFCSAETGFEKPHPMAFRAALRFAAPSCAVWMVGDNFIADIQGAWSVGVPGILVRNYHPDARYSCKSLLEIADIIN